MFSEILDKRSIFGQEFRFSSKRAKLCYTDWSINTKNSFWTNGMSISDLKADERVEAVYFTRNALVVDLADGRTISVPLRWYPKLLRATPKQRSHWEICGGGYGIHWPEIDEDLSTEGLLRGSPAPGRIKPRMTRRKISRSRKRKLV